MINRTFVEKRRAQLNTQEISKQNLEAKMSGLPVDSKLLEILVEAHDKINVAQWNAERGRNV